MRNYRLYLIKDEIANHYSGRERLFFNLFSEYMRTNDQQLKRILQKQIQFITLPVPKWKLERKLMNELQTNNEFSYNHEWFTIQNDNLSRAVLKMEENYIQVEAKGYYDAESIFFEVIRKNIPSFLAIDIENGLYGWLKPIKERNFV